MRWTLLATALCAPACLCFAQFPPPAGQPGTTAMYQDSSVFRAWASKCSLEPGYVNCMDTTVEYMGSNKANYGFPEDATGPPDNFVVSLGDRGVATLSLPAPMYDSTGPDFAVFENSFSDVFLELGFVEVSSNGIDFVRFASVSLTPEEPQVPTFGELDATKIHNLAGKYRVFYGTPFDLAELIDSINVDISAVTHIRIIDVGGCIQSGYQSFDSQGHVINDPWPTPFNTCGLDLDAVGIIHTQVQAIPSEDQRIPIRLYPNPVHHQLSIDHHLNSSLDVKITDLTGRIFKSEQSVDQSLNIDLSDLPPGIYLVGITLEDGSVVTRKIIKD